MKKSLTTGVAIAAITFPSILGNALTAQASSTPVDAPYIGTPKKADVAQEGYIGGSGESKVFEANNEYVYCVLKNNSLTKSIPLTTLLKEDAGSFTVLFTDNSTQPLHFAGTNDIESIKENTNIQVAPVFNLDEAAFTPGTVEESSQNATSPLTKNIIQTYSNANINYKTGVDKDGNLLGGGEIAFKFKLAGKVNVNLKNRTVKGISFHSPSNIQLFWGTEHVQSYADDFILNEGPVEPDTLIPTDF